MLLSLFAAFLLKRWFQGRIYGLLVILILIFASFFSVGIPILRPSPYINPVTENGILVQYPIPLSFPIFSYLVSNDGQIRHTATLWYQVLLFNFVILEDWVFYGGILNFSLFEYALYFSLFMLVNIVGALIGYWLGMRKSASQSLSSPKG
jgi:hypothetical protein